MFFEARVIFSFTHKKFTCCIILFPTSRFDPYPPYGSRRRLITPMYDEYGEAFMEDEGYYYGGPEVMLHINLLHRFLNLYFMYHFMAI